MLSKKIIALIVFSLTVLTVSGQFTRPRPTYPTTTSLAGNWIMNSVGEYNTNINVTISSNTISFRYCNTQSYTYTTSGNNRISIKSGFSTLIMCRMATPPSQDQVRNALNSASVISISGNRLTLRNNRNQVIATLTKSSGSNPTNPTNPSQPSQSIVGNWTATTAKGHSVSFAVTITANAVSYRYCNSKNMNYTTNGNNINFSLGISTMMACFNQNPDQDTVFSAFSDAKTYSISNGVLTFFDASRNVVLRLTSGPAPITGTYNLGSINNVATTELNKVAVTISGTNISFRYCNGKNFPYTINGNNISIQSGMSTLMFCQGLSPPENEVSQAFTAAKTFQISGNTLTLFGEDGRIRATLFKA